MGLIKSHNEEIINEFIKYLKNHIDVILEPTYVKYTKEDSMSAADPSYIYSQITGGIKKPKLSDRMPKFKNSYDIIYEYGFDDNDKFLYRKAYTQDGRFYFDNYYMYSQNKIYCVGVKGNHNIESIEDYRNIDSFQYSLLEEYVFDDKGRPIQIINHYNGYGIREDYQWIDDDVAVIKDRLPKYLMIKDKGQVVAICSIEYGNVNRQKLSYQSNGYIDLDNYSLRSTSILRHSRLDIEYSLVNDMNGKVTEYYELRVLNQKYFVFINFMKPPVGFSYMKAKELYKNEIIHFIDDKINRCDFEMKTVGIQYGNFGYSILDLMIGFDKGNHSDIHTMSECIDYDFSIENKEMISWLDDYIKTQSYYQSFHKLMVSLKKDIEEKYNIKVILEEVID